MTWRQEAERVIRKVAAENPGLGESELRKKFSEAYPFGERAMYPYKVWLDAIKNYFLPPCIRRGKHRVPLPKQSEQLFSEEQQDMSSAEVQA